MSQRRCCIPRPFDTPLLFAPLRGYPAVLQSHQGHWTEAGGTRGGWRPRPLSLIGFKVIAFTLLGELVDSDRTSRLLQVLLLPLSTQRYRHVRKDIPDPKQEVNDSAHRVRNTRMSFYSIHRNMASAGVDYRKTARRSRPGNFLQVRSATALRSASSAKNAVLVCTKYFFSVGTPAPCDTSR